VKGSKDWKYLLDLAIKQCWQELVSEVVKSNSKMGS
jgi:hypothetical protein